MFKLTLWDENIPAGVSGVTCFFVDELNEFEDSWIKKEIRNEEQKQRYLKSKSGEIITDYYSDDPKLNIVQEDKEAEVLWEKDYAYTEKTFRLLNAYHWPMMVYAKNAYIRLRYIRFREEYFLTGQYSLEGLCCEDTLWGKRGNGYREISVWGNPIVNIELKDRDDWFDKEIGLNRADYPKEEFS